ncbi:piggyBac transposable element-derived protein 4-like isoform X1 [Acipenser ruthenus]|uniref:piggyBac transposable element-derived protein 4-like isoform X1 n=2 Tax=Acipenser ruthenus TaxID=7906 RepID=UPI0027421E8C|nr:piggyBac transposable element-derived protein 4-like isoform X1 [Acipenser ruthenus]XP_058875954.1 piggyBac transposable element-derived protein 4-like isoform X1 [Acipenser ruthenus]
MSSVRAQNTRTDRSGQQRAVGESDRHADLSDSDSSDNYLLSSDEEEAISQGIDASLESDPEGGLPCPSVKRGRVSVTPASLQDGDPNRWRDAGENDSAPVPPRFAPRRVPGPQLDAMRNYSHSDLFLLFFSRAGIQKICSHTNKQAGKRRAKGSKARPWNAVGKEQFCVFLALVLYMGLVRLPALADYWSEDSFFGAPFCGQLMSRNAFLGVLWNLRLSDPEADEENERKRGTPDYDPLWKLQPFLKDLQASCKAQYHPNQNLSLDERTVAAKASIGPNQSPGDEPAKWGYKLFVLADSLSGYTWNFEVYAGKRRQASGKGLSYDIATSLMDCSLGSGYRLYCGSFFTSPVLFRDLLSKETGACGTIRECRRGYPATKPNGLDRKSPRGTIKWLRQEEVLFLKWRDVSLCTTFHKAQDGRRVRRKIKSRDGTGRNASPPGPIQDYNRRTRGGDQSDQLLDGCSVPRETNRWYKTLFFQFVNIATANSFILHREICEQFGQQPDTQKMFLRALVFELAGELYPLQTTSLASPYAMQHLPEPLARADATARRSKTTRGRQSCVYCRRTEGKQIKTPWQCRSCDVPLCAIVDRNCFSKWHRRFLPSQTHACV